MFSFFDGNKRILKQIIEADKSLSPILACYEKSASVLKKSAFLCFRKDAESHDILTMDFYNQYSSTKDMILTLLKNNNTVYKVDESKIGVALSFIYFNMTMALFNNGCCCSSSLKFKKALDSYDACIGVFNETNSYLKRYAPQYLKLWETTMLDNYTSSVLNKGNILKREYNLLVDAFNTYAEIAFLSTNKAEFVSYVNNLDDENEKNRLEEHYREYMDLTKPVQETIDKAGAKWVELLYIISRKPKNSCNIGWQNINCPAIQVEYNMRNKKLGETIGNVIPFNAVTDKAYEEGFFNVASLGSVSGGEFDHFFQVTKNQKDIYYLVSLGYY